MKLWNRFKWWCLTRKLCRAAIKLGCDTDGDIVYYKGYRWVVDVSNHEVSKDGGISYYTKTVERSILDASRKSHAVK